MQLVPAVPGEDGGDHAGPRYAGNLGEALAAGPDQDEVGGGIADHRDLGHRPGLALEGVDIHPVGRRDRPGDRVGPGQLGPGVDGLEREGQQERAGAASAPTSFDPFIKEVNAALDRQIALTYLSTHLKKGFHRVKITSSTPGVEIHYPAGYRR